MGTRILILAACLAGVASVALADDLKKLHTFDGDTSLGLKLGRSVSGAGDVDNDGFDDVIAGGGSYARVYSGKTGKVLHTFEGVKGEQFGSAVSGAGDVNKDGYADLIVGACWADYAKVYSGKDGKTLYTFKGSSGDWFGHNVSDAGDVNRDGYADVIVGAYKVGSHTGKAYVYSG